MLDIDNESSFQLGEWWVEPMANRLARGGETVTIEPRVMELLVYLARHAGEVVAAEDIFSQVWPNVVVGDNALYRCVGQIRKVLGDNAAEPRYIVTVPKRGYRLVADVNVNAAVSAEVGGTKNRSPSTAPASASTPTVARPIIILAGGTLLLILAVGLYLILAKLGFRDAEEAAHGRLASIAVLPFANVSDQPDNEYFALGLSDEILNTLGQVKGLDVVARTSSYAVTDLADVREIGTRLNADSIVEGTVRKAGNAIRVHVQLIDVDSGFDMWSGEYNRDLDDVFAVQEEIAESILDALSEQLNIALPVDIPQPQSAALETFDLYLLGRHYLRSRQPADLLRAVSFFSRGIDQEQGYAPVYAGIAEAYLLQAEYGDLGLAEAVELAEPMIGKALALDETLAEGHAALGLSRYYQGRHQEAQAALRTTIELNPSHAMANMWLGLSLAYREGRISESQRLYERAQSLDPLNVTLALNIAYNLSRLGHYAEALERLQVAGELHPDSVWVQLGIAQVAADYGRFDISHGAASRALALRPDSARAMTMLAYAYSHVGDLERAEHWIAQTEQAGTPTSHWHLYVAQAAVYLQRGEAEALTAFLRGLTVDDFEPDPLLFFSPQLWQAEGAAGTGQMLVGGYQEAAEHFERYLQSIGDHRVTQLSEDVLLFLEDFVYVSRKIGWGEASERILAEAVDAIAEARQSGWNTNLLTFYEARLRVLEGDSQRALEALEQAVDDGFSIAWWLQADPIWDGFRADATFQGLMKRIDASLLESSRRIEEAGTAPSANL